MDWIDKTINIGNRNRLLGIKSVLVSLNKYGDRQRGIRFGFSDYSGADISKSGYIKLGIDGNRLYFAEADSNGYKIIGTGRTVSTSIALTDNTELLTEWAGRHPLHYDEKQGLYYINKED